MFHPSRRKNKFATWDPKSSNLRNTLWIILIGILTWSNPPTILAAENSDQENSKNELWREYNFYQILGLEEVPAPGRRRIGDATRGDVSAKKRAISKKQEARRKVTSNDVKKAYRAQAQVWHPDKVQHKLLSKQQINQTYDSNTRALVEEATERFSLISEAHQVLSDAHQKIEYDQDLAQEELLQIRQHTTTSHSGHNSWSDLLNDPWSAFEMFRNDRDQPRRPHPSVPPDSVSERTESHYDPFYGNTIYRIYRKEEWSAEGYYRILQQDFTLVDRGRYGGVSYESIGGPVLAEEGYLSHHHHARHSQPPQDDLSWMNTPEYKAYRNNAQNRDSRRSSSRRNAKNNKYTHVMLDMEYITPDSEPLQSKNGHYLAYLSNACELTVVKQNEAPQDSPFHFASNEQAANTVVWTSDSYYPPGVCFLALLESQLVLLAGTDPAHVNSVLWTSPGDNEGNDNNRSMNYYLALEDEGVLAVYKTSQPQSDRRGRPLSQINLARHIQSFLKRTTYAVCQATISNTAKSANNSKNQDCDSLSNHYSTEQTRSHTEQQDTCIWASSSEGVSAMFGGGCSNVGRRMNSLTTIIRSKSQEASSNLQITIDNFVHYLRNDPRDIDAIDTLVRLIRDAVHLAAIEQKSALLLIQKRIRTWSLQWRIVQSSHARRREEWNVKFESYRRRIQK